MSFFPSIVYENRAADAITAALARWGHVEEIVNAIEWALIHDPAIGPIINERGIRAFVYPGARSIKEPDVDILYEERPDRIVIHDVTFRDAKAHYAGKS